MINTRQSSSLSSAFCSTLQYSLAHSSTTKKKFSNQLSGDYRVDAVLYNYHSVGSTLSQILTADPTVSCATVDVTAPNSIGLLVAQQKTRPLEHGTTDDLLPCWLYGDPKHDPCCTMTGLGPELEI